MITDCYTKEIVSWYVGETMEAWCSVECTESGDPKDNAVAERQNNTVKNELLKDIKFRSMGEVRRVWKKLSPSTTTNGRTCR